MFDEWMTTLNLLLLNDDHADDDDDVDDTIRYSIDNLR